MVFSNIRQKILDTRPIVVTDYTSEYQTNSEITVIPREYTHGELSKENKIYYWIVTIFMAALPVLYIIAASVLVAKLYYKLKLQVPLENLKNGISHISEQDLDFQLQYTSDDELGELCDTFEYMKNEIYKLIAKRGICYRKERP